MEERHHLGQRPQREDHAGDRAKAQRCRHRRGRLVRGRPAQGAAGNPRGRSVIQAHGCGRIQRSRPSRRAASCGARPPIRPEIPMSKRFAALLFGLSLASAGSAADTFEAGKHWFPVEPPQPTSTGDKVEVVEVFSYACPACNFFEPTMRKLEAALPPNAEVVHLPASFRPDEDWPVFQRAYYTAQALGILDKSHKAMFGAVWN